MRRSKNTTVIRTEKDWEKFWLSLERSWENVDPTPLMAGWFEELEVIHHGYFNSESGPDGQGWAQLAQSTIDRKGHDTILYETERLVRSLINSGGDAIRDLQSSGNVKSLVFGSSVPYSVFHNAETGREHIGINDGHLDEFTAAVADDALKQMRAA